MVGLGLLFFFICAFLAQEARANTESRECTISLCATSLSLAVAAQGAVSILLLWLHLDPRISLAAWTLLIAATYLRKRWRENYQRILRGIWEESRNITHEALTNKVFLSALGFSLCLILVSVGPINHPDASDYHAGYPLQFYRLKRLVIDGGLTQGLLGLGDYAHISPIQEKQIWLIRTIQTLPLLIICSHLRQNNKALGYLSIAAFMTSPAWIQAFTIGKPLFLGEACTSLAYIYYARRQGAFSLSLLACCIVNSVAFKISSILFCFPMVANIVIAERKGFKIVATRAITSRPVLLALLALTILIVERCRVTGNPFYPFLSNLLTPENTQFVNFEAMLKGYRRDWLSALELLMPLSFGTIAMSLGPALSLFSLQSILILNSTTSWLRQVGYVATTQFFLLTTVGQIRADYFLGWTTLIFLACSYLEMRPKIWRATRFFLIIQLVLFATVTTASLYLSFMSLVDYPETMKKSAYGHSLSELASNQLQPDSKYTVLAGRNTRLYYSDYVDKDLFSKCLAQSSMSERGTYHSFSVIAKGCMKELNVSRIYTQPAFADSLSKELFDCEEFSLDKAARNPFNRDKEKVSSCILRPD